MALGAWEWTGDELFQKKIIEEKIYRRQRKENVYSRFMSEDGTTPVYELSLLENKKGNEILFHLIPDLNTEGIPEGVTLRGKEKRLDGYTNSLKLTMIREGLSTDRMSIRRSNVIDILKEMQIALKQWGVNFRNRIITNALLDNPSRIFYLQSSSLKVTTDVNIAKTNTDTKLSLEALSAIKRIVLSEKYKAEYEIPFVPVTINGVNWIVVFVPPDVAYDFVNNPTFNQYRQFCIQQSIETKHPIFTGGILAYDGVVLHEIDEFPIYTNWGAGDSVGAHCVVCGAGAVLWANGNTPEIIPGEDDYGEVKGLAYRVEYQCQKAKFNGIDYGSVALFVASTNIRRMIV